MSGVWGKEVVVVLHHVPEDEDFEGGYEAETLTGTPNNVKMAGSDRDSKEEALNHLAGALTLLGFRGRLLVDDVTEVGRRDRYELEIPEDVG